MTVSKWVTIATTILNGLFHGLTAIAGNPSTQQLKLTENLSEPFNLEKEGIH